MSDLEIVKACSVAMGYEAVEWSSFNKPPHGIAAWTSKESNLPPFNYDPIHDDAQCFALVKKFQLTVYWIADAEGGWAASYDFGPKVYADNANINRAICECVSKMKGTP